MSIFTSSYMSRREWHPFSRSAVAMTSTRYPFPLPAFLSAFPIQTSCQTARLRPCTSPLMCVTTSENTFELPRRVSRSVVWFRAGDFRTEDHPGLDAACLHTADALAPLMVMTPSSTPADFAAAMRMRAQLHTRGSVLVLRFAEDEAEGVAKFMKEFKAERVHVRMDIELEARQVVSKVKQLMDGIASVQTWTTELREWDDCDEDILYGLPDEYPKFLKWPVRNRTPIVTSNVDFHPEVILPGPGLDDGDVSVEDVAELVTKARPESEQKKAFMKRIEKDDQFTRTLSYDPADENFGEAILKEYLRQSDAYQCPDLGRSLAELFRQGALSPRRIHEIVSAHERGNGRIWKFVYRDGARLVLDFLDAREFATLMARSDTARQATVDGAHQAKFWRWRGYLVRYIEEGTAHKGLKEKPPLLLVHGFGASSQHYRRSVRLLKENYHVFAIDLIGFGRSEKPPMQYTGDLWENMIWDFVRDVVGRPVYIAGNSIGGYFSACFAVDAYRDLCEGVCLINTSGKLEDRGRQVMSGQTERKGLFKYVMSEWRAARILVGRALLRSLQGRVLRTLRFVYPTNPEAADEQLARNIMRDSFDYGAADVLASGLILPSPRSLTHLLERYEGPLLVFQGDLDPLNNAAGRAEKIKMQYPTATVVHVQAGHCPHEEAAEQFVEAIGLWMDVTNADKARASEVGVERAGRVAL